MFSQTVQRFKKSIIKKKKFKKKLKKRVYFLDLQRAFFPPSFIMVITE